MFEHEREKSFSNKTNIVADVLFQSEIDFSRFTMGKSIFEICAFNEIGFSLEFDEKFGKGIVSPMRC